MNSKLSLLCITLSIGMAALFSGTDPSYSCGPSADYEKYRISYVDPDLLSDSIYQSFYRTILQDHQASDNYYDRPHEEFRGWDNGLDFREKENIQDWQSYFGGTISTRSIHDLIYNSSSQMIDSLLSALEKGERFSLYDPITEATAEWDQPDTLFFSEVLRIVESRSDAPFLRYLLFANECSSYAYTPDPWDENPVPKDTAAMLELVDQGIDLHNNCHSEFLKLRYAYQVVRTARYAGQYERAIKLYDKLVGPNPTKSPIRFWALGHKAGAERWSGKFALSNYHFAQVFDSCAGEREIAVRDFGVDEEDEQDWNEVYRLAQNNHERATLWMLRGFETEGLNFDYIQEMYKLEPNSPQLATALLRELHRIESYLYQDMETRDYTVRTTGMTEAYDYDKDTVVQSNVEHDYPYWRDDYTRHLTPGRTWDTLYYYKTSDEEGATPQLVKVLSGKDYVKAFRHFVLETGKSGKVMEPALWYMVAGYIDMMDGDNQLAGECLEEAGRESRGNYDLDHQIQLLNYLRQAKSQGRVGVDIESHIAETLRWFREKQAKNRHSKYDKVMAAFGQEYLRQNDVPKAILAFNAANDQVTRNVLLDIYSTPNDLEKLQELVEKSGKSGYEQVLVDSFSLGRNDLLDLRGTRLMRRGNFDDALKLFEQISPSYWNAPPDTTEYGWVPPNYRSFYSNMDTARITGMNIMPLTWDADNPDSVARSIPHTIQYNKLTFARAAVDLQKSIIRNDGGNAGKAAFQLATLLFNTPYWGYADGVWQGDMLMEIRYYYFSATSYPFNVQGVAERMGKQEKEFMDEYGSRQMARNYYTRAIDETKDRELAARSLYMIDLCNKQPQTTLHAITELGNQDRTGYNLLLTKYRDTRFAKQILSQCSVYKYFAQGSKKK